MPKKSERSSDEYYRGIIRELNKEIRQLKKQIKELSKYQHIPDIEDIQESEPIIKSRTCPSCGKGKLKELDIVGRIFEKCDICDHRKKIK